MRRFSNWSLLTRFLTVAFLGLLVGASVLSTSGCTEKSTDSDSTMYAIDPAGPQPPEPEEDTLFTFAINSDTVHVVDVVFNDPQNYLEYKLWINPAVGANYARGMRVTGSDAFPLGQGATCVLKPLSGASLFEITVEWKDSLDGIVAYTERAEGDSLRWQYYVSNDVMYESFVQDGNTLSLSHPDATPEEIAEAVAEWQSDPENATQSTDPLIQAIVEFDEFYDGGTSISENVNGELLVRLMMNESFKEWRMDHTFPLGLSGELDLSQRMACGIAGTCAGIKCWVGGYTNPACLICSGYSLACAIADIALACIGSE